MVGVAVVVGVAEAVPEGVPLVAEGVPPGVGVLVTEGVGVGWRPGGVPPLTGPVEGLGPQTSPGGQVGVPPRSGNVTVRLSPQESRIPKTTKLNDNAMNRAADRMLPPPLSRAH